MSGRARITYGYEGARETTRLCLHLLVSAALIGADEDRIVSEVFTLLDDKAAYSAMARAHNPFGDGQAAGRIAKGIADGFGL